MSLQSELTRLQANATSISSSKDAIMTALASKGVTVPAGATLHDVPNLIGMIDGSAPEPPTPSTSVVIGGHTYKTVIIGNQEWLAENLDYKFQYNGSTLPIGGSEMPSTPKAWYYDNNEAGYGIDGTYKCGLLYNWHAVKYLDDNKSTLLPDGWHVPTSTEWDTLIDNIDGDSTAGIKLKALDNSIASNWPSGWNGSDDYGFSALPAGRYDHNSFNSLDSETCIWTSTESSDTYSTYRCLDTGSSLSPYNTGLKIYGFSLRLVRTLS